MKKITLLIALFMVSIGFSQELITNGDFENGATGWAGNALNVVTEGGNSYNSADVETAVNPWDVNINYPLALTPNKTYTLVFDAWSDQERILRAGIGLNKAPWSAATEDVTLGTTSQTYTLTLIAPGDVDADSRVLFDMGAWVGFVGIDNVSLMEAATADPTCDDGIQNGDETGVDCGGSCDPCSTAGVPTVAAAAPTEPAANVRSVFSDVYTDLAGTNWGPDWGGSSSRINDVDIAGNATKVIDMNAGQTFAGIDFAANKFDATTFASFHMDYYIPGPLLTGQVLNIKLSNHDGGAETNAIQTTITAITVDGWVSLSVPLNDMVAAGDPNASDALSRNNIAQIVISAARADTNEPLDIYLDNIYFYSEQPLSTKEFDLAQVKAFPNPVSNNLTIQSNSVVKNVNVYNVLGKQVKSVKELTGNTLNVSDLKSGVYIVKFTIDGATGTKKFIKQ